MAASGMLLICTLVATSLIGLDAKDLSIKRTQTLETTTTRPPTSTQVPTTRICKDWEQAGVHSCSFVCGLNGQWYPEDIWGRKVLGAKHCEEPGKVMPSQCPYYCIDGKWLLGPCKYCCHDYSENQCKFTCDLELTIHDGCDPFNGTLPKVVGLEQESTQAENVDEPECSEGDTKGFNTCSFICGLNQQWYPKIRGKETPEGARKCTEKGSIVSAECPSVCIEGRWRMKSCPYCCEEYTDNHCGIACHKYLFLEEGCDPFNSPHATRSSR